MKIPVYCEDAYAYQIFGTTTGILVGYSYVACIVEDRMGKHYWGVFDQDNDVSATFSSRPISR